LSTEIPPRLKTSGDAIGGWPAGNYPQGGAIGRWAQNVKIAAAVIWRLIRAAVPLIFARELGLVIFAFEVCVTQICLKPLIDVIWKMLGLGYMKSKTFNRVNLKFKQTFAFHKWVLNFSK
jgi:hypothetical protein